MNLEQLKDYEDDEAERFDAFLKGLEAGKADSYPPRERFNRLTEPVAKRAQDESIWPQIPIYGSLIIPLLPVQEADFSKTHHFEALDLPGLMDLCKDTGRVQFTLAARPTQFANLDYLDPILSELRPPVVRTIPNTAVFDDAALRKTNLQFDTMAGISLWPLIRTTLANSGLDYLYAEQTYDTLRSTYAMLKLLGYHNTIAEIEDSMISDAPRAYRVLYFYNQFIKGPIFDPLKGVYCFSRDYIKGMKRISGSESSSQTDQFPSEIGTLLLNSITLVPESMDACQGVIDLYGRNGVMRIIADLTSAVADDKLDVIVSTSVQLKRVLQNVWDDARERIGTITGVSQGISFEVVAAGLAAGQPLGGPPGRAAGTGLLAELGFKLADKGVESASESIDGRYAKVISKSYAISVYNFRKKIRLDRT